MHIFQSIHDVSKVRAIRLDPQSSNAVTIEIDTVGGVIHQTLFFGTSAYAAGEANALFYALRGNPSDVIGSDE